MNVRASLSDLAGNTESTAPFTSRYHGDMAMSALVPTQIGTVDHLSE